LTFSKTRFVMQND